MGTRIMSAALKPHLGSVPAPGLTLWSPYQSLRSGSRTDATSFQPEHESALPGLAVPSWADVETRLRDLLDLQPGWDSYGGQPPSPELVAYVAAQLRGVKALHLPPPTILPSGDGQILATWRGQRIEIELWFQAPYSETVVIDDETSPNESFAGVDPRLSATTRALRRIGTGM